MSPLQAVDASASAAPFLFAEAEIGFEKLEAVGEFSGERLLARRPEIYRTVVRMLAEGMSISSISRACQVSRNTVAAVREREGVSIEQQKKELLATIRRGSQVAAERVMELLPSIQSAKDAAITLAVLVDKAQLLSGEATSRIERVDSDQDKLRDMLASLPVLEAEVVVTGPHGSGSGQKGGLPGAVVAGAEGAGIGGSDARSEVLTPVSLLTDAASATLTATFTGAEVEPVAVAVEAQGGEGVAILHPPLTEPTDLPEQKILSKGASDAPHS